MALKYKIDEETFKALKAPLQGEYKKGEDSSYVLDVDGIEDTGALKRAKEHEKELRKGVEAKLKEAEDRFKELTAQMDELRADKIRGGDKVAETEKAWGEKLKKRENELTSQIDAVQKALRSQMEDSVAISLASKLAGDNSELILPHIQKRLRAEIVEGKAVTKVIGPDGEVSATTIEELEKEFLTNTKFSSVIVGSKASGSGTAGARKGAGGPAKKSLSEMTGVEEAQFARSNPEEYAKMIANEKPAGFSQFS